MYEKFKRSEWFRHDRFGMFIHWGLYAIPSRGEWVRSNEKMTDEEYQRYFNEFDPSYYDPKEWARIAKEAGMKYAVMTAKHHDGFCLFDSKYTDFKSTNTPCGRDLVREFLDAFRAEGLKVGLYYSLLDWNHPAFPAYQHPFHPRTNDESYKEREPFENYLNYMHSQVEELCSSYGKIDIMWFDFSYGDMTGEKWEATKLVNMVRSYLPDIVLDNRLEVSGQGLGSLATETPTVYSGDFVSPEHIIPPDCILNELGEPIPWESCFTLNDHWGYCANDDNYKDESVVVRKLAECVSKSGNMLLNVGPDAEGRFTDKSIDVLLAVGKWMKKNSSSIYGCMKSEFPKPEWGRYTQNRKDVYALVIDPPVGPLPLYGIPKERISSCRLLAGGSELKLLTDDWRTQSYNNTAFVNIPKYSTYDKILTVIKITLKDQ